MPCGLYIEQFCHFWSDQSRGFVFMTASAFWIIGILSHKLFNVYEVLLCWTLTWALVNNTILWKWLEVEYRLPKSYPHLWWSMRKKFYAIAGLLTFTPWSVPSFLEISFQLLRDQKQLTQLDNDVSRVEWSFVVPGSPAGRWGDEKKMVSGKRWATMP